MDLTTKDMDMLHGPLAGKLLSFALPIALSSILQQLFNAADTAVVGSFGDADALAAVGTNAEIVALIVTLSSGLAIGANVLAANKIGQDRREELPAILWSFLWLAVLLGIVELVLGQGIAGPLLRLIWTPEPIFRAAEGYLRIYLLGCPFLLLYDFGSALLRARGDSRSPFLALMVSGAVNVALNLFFVVVSRMGVAGVAAATDLSSMLSAALVLHRLAADGSSRSTSHPPRFSLKDAAEMLMVGIPAALQGAVFCFANLFVQASVNSFGETAIAGSTIAMAFEYLTYYVITAFGQTATTFTSQNHAAGQSARCVQTLWLCLGLSTLCSSIPIFTIVLFRDRLSSLFTPEPAVIRAAAERIWCILLFEPLCNWYEIPAGALRGRGHSLWPAVSTILSTCAFRILWVCTVFRADPALPTLYRAFPLSWVLTILLVGAGFPILRRWEARYGGRASWPFFPGRV